MLQYTYTQTAFGCFEQFEYWQGSTKQLYISVLHLVAGIIFIFAEQSTILSFKYHKSNLKLDEIKKTVSVKKGLLKNLQQKVRGKLPNSKLKFFSNVFFKMVKKKSLLGYWIINFHINFCFLLIIIFLKL